MKLIKYIPIFKEVVSKYLNMNDKSSISVSTISNPKSEAKFINHGVMSMSHARYCVA